MRKGSYIVFNVKSIGFAGILFFPEGSTGMNDSIIMSVPKRLFGGKVELQRQGRIIIYEPHETDGKRKKIVVDNWDHG